MGETWVKVVIVILSVAALVGAGYFVEREWNAAIESASEKADQAGYDRARKELAERDNKALQEALTKVKQLEEAARAAEAKAAQEIADARTAHAREVADAELKRARLAADLRSGQRRLRDAEGRCATTAPASSDGRKAVAADPAGSAGGSGCELSERAGIDLSNLASRADRVRATARLCQTTLIAYAAACKER